MYKKKLIVLILVTIVAIVAGKCFSETEAVTKSNSSSNIDQVQQAIEGLKSKDYTDRISAVAILGNSNDPRAIEPLISAFRGPEKDIRLPVAVALGNSKDPRAVGALIDALKDSDANVRNCAALGLGNSGDSRAVEPLLDVLKDPDKEVRVGAVMALGRLNDSRAVEPLIDALKDSAVNLRYYAVEGLGNLNDPRAIEPLISILEDPDVNVANKAENALETITRQSFGKDPSVWQEWWKKNKDGFKANAEEPIAVTKEYLSSESGTTESEDALDYSDQPLQFSIKSDKQLYKIGESVNIEVDIRDNFKYPVELKVPIFAIYNEKDRSDYCVYIGEIEPLALSPNETRKLMFDLYSLKWYRDFSFSSHLVLSNFLKAGSYEVNFAISVVNKENNEESSYGCDPVTIQVTE